MTDFSNIFSLKDKVAIVTGGYGHLGRAIVKGLLDFDAKVIVGARSFEKYKNEFGEDKTDKIFFTHLDITETASINKFVEEINRKHNRIDVLINNAVTTKGIGQIEICDEDWNYTMEGALGSVFKMLRAVAPIMKKQKCGKIINISSMYGIVSPDFSLYDGEKCEKYLNPPHYGAAKAGIIQITKYFAVMLGKYNIFVNSITPGPFPNKDIQEENAEFIKRLSLKNPLQRIGKPEDLVGAIVLLSTNASNFMTGQNIQVDGGWTIW